MGFMGFSSLVYFHYTDRIFAALQAMGGTNRFIGGCVRDAIAKKKIEDIDIATDLLPFQVQEALTLAKIKNLPVGLEHGTITAIIDKQKFEITTLRKDISTDGRRAVVKFTNNWIEDAKRRDFTINAMSYCPLKNKLYDYFNGVSDLEKRVVKFIGDPSARILEDYLRILRYFRFLAYYGRKTLDLGSFDACKKNATLINKLSAERKCKELTKLLKTPHNEWAIELMFKAGILQELLPNIKSDFLKLLNTAQLLEKNLGNEINFLIKLLVIIDNSQDSVHEVTSALRLPNKQMKYLSILCELTPRIKESALLALVYQYGKNEVTGALILHFINNDKTDKETCLLIKNIQKLKLQTIPISGHEIMKAFTLKQSTEIGQLLRIAQTHWIKSNFASSQEELIAMLKRYI